MPKLTHIRLVRVQYVPRVLEPGILYVSEEFDAMIHLCACGCGTKVSTPMGPTEWKLDESAEGPSLSPSIGNWQFPCQSHYWINQGKVVWSGKWSTEQIEAGRRAEEKRRREYYDQLHQKRAGILTRIWRWIIGLFKKNN